MDELLAEIEARGWAYRLSNANDRFGLWAKPNGVYRAVVTSFRRYVDTNDTFQEVFYGEGTTAVQALQSAYDGATMNEIYLETAPLDASVIDP